MVSIVGLGIDPSDLTEGAKQELLSGKKIIVRAERFAAAVRALGVSFETLDCVYESSRNFDSLHKNLAARVLGAAKERDVVYCVPGSVEEDISAQIVLKKSRGAAVFDSVSKSADAFRRAKIFSCNRAAYSAYDLEKYIRAVLPLCVYDIDCDLVAGDVKLKLCDMLGDETPCFFVKNGKVKKIKLYELDRQKEYDETTALVVDDTPLLKKKRFDFYDLCEVMRRLRAPGGCPWDRAQTHESIRKNMVEEAYELVDAIDSKDDGKIVEEAGDVLMPGGLSRATRRGQGRVRLRGRHERRVQKNSFSAIRIFSGATTRRTRTTRSRCGSATSAPKRGKRRRATAWRTYPRAFPRCCAPESGQARIESGLRFQRYRRGRRKNRRRTFRTPAGGERGRRRTYFRGDGRFAVFRGQRGAARGRGLRRKPAREHEKIRRAVFKDGEPHFTGRKRDAKPRARGTLGVLRAGKGTNRCRSVPLK